MKKIILTQGKYAIISDRDFKSVSKYKWYAQKRRNTFYAATSPSIKGGEKRTLLYMHRLITGAPLDKQVDHINRDGLNNTRKNLRVVTHSQNQHNRKTQKNNTSGYTGVSLRKGRWVAQIKIKGKQTGLGYFLSREDARKAYLKAVKKYHD